MHAGGEIISEDSIELAVGLFVVLLVVRLSV